MRSLAQAAATQGRVDAPIIEYPTRHKHHRLHRFAIVPFETGIAVASIWGGIGSIFGFATTGFRFALPPSMVLIFNILYIVSGVAILFGVGWGYRNFEAAGLILLIMSLLVRAISIIATFGAAPAIMSAQVTLRASDVLSAQVTALIFIGAAACRLFYSVADGTIVQVHRVTIDVEDQCE